MFQKTKCDPELGQKVEDHLVSIGLNTPYYDNGLRCNEKIDIIEENMTVIMQVLGLDLTDDSLIESPKRVAKMMVLDKFWGLKPEHFPKCTTVENKMQYDQMVVLDDIRVLSDCEHHFVTIDGYAKIAYIPKPGGKVLGLSKFSRITEYFSRRPQIQERLTQQIGETLKFILETDDIAVQIDAKHYCVISRGVEDQNVTTGTTFLSGAFRDETATRLEFMNRK